MLDAPRYPWYFIVPSVQPCQCTDFPACSQPFSSLGLQSKMFHPHSGSSQQFLSLSFVNKTAFRSQPSPFQTCPGELYSWPHDHKLRIFLSQNFKLVQLLIINQNFKNMFKSTVCSYLSAIYLNSVSNKI